MVRLWAVIDQSVSPVGVGGGEGRPWEGVQREGGGEEEEEHTPRLHCTPAAASRGR